MRNARLYESQAGIKIPGRNINNLRYADGTTLKAEKSWLKTQHSKKKITASGSITSWEIDGKTVETVSEFILGGSKITADGDCSHEIKRCLLLIFPGGSDGKASAYNAGDLGSISGSGRSPREGNGNPLQYSFLENPMDGGTW